ncbi:MAG: PAS domain S-box protein [Cyanobacteria bacterium J06592_8]
MSINPLLRLLNPKLRFPLQLILIVPFALQIVAVVGAIGYISHRNSQDAVQDLVSQLMNELGEHVDERLDNYLDEPILLTNINVDAIEIGYLSLDNLSVVESRFFLQIQRVETLESIYLGTETGEYLGVYRTSDLSLASSATSEYYQQLTKRRTPSLKSKSPLNINDDYDPRTRPWYQTGIQNRQATWSPIYAFTDGNLGITATRPFYDRDGNLQGVMAVDVVLTVFSDVLRQLKLTPSAQTFILERSGELVATSTDEPVYEMTPQNQLTRLQGIESQNPLTRAAIQHLISFTGSLKNIDQVKSLELKIEGQQYFVDAVPYSDSYGLDWLIVVVVPEADFMAQINANRRMAIVFGLAALVLAIGLGGLTSRWIAGQILQLARASQAIAFGQLNQKVNVARVSELKMLADSFNQMARQLKTAFEELEIRVEERTSQLKDANQQLREEVWERRQAERALRLSENKFSKAFQSNPNPSFITQFSDGYIVDFNESALKLLGYESNDIFNKNVKDFNFLINPEDRNYIADILNKDGVIRSYECEFHTKSGEIRIALYSAELIDLNGQTCVLSIFSDITERKQAELALQKRSQIDHSVSRIFQQFVDQDVNPAIDFALAEIGQLTQIDRCYILQYADQGRQLVSMTNEWCNQDITSTMSEVQEMPVKLFDWGFKQLKSHKIVHIPDINSLPKEALSLKREWKKRGLKSILIVPMISVGKVVGAVCCSMIRSPKEWTLEEIKLIQRVGEMIPISLERDLAEQKLQESQERLAGILDNAEDAIISVNENHKILLFNHGAEKIFGYSSAETIGKSLDILLPMDAREIHHRYVLNFARLECQSRGMGERSREVCGWRKNGERFPAEASISKIKMGEGWIFTAILKDITKRKQAETALEQAKDAAEAANRAKSEFLANMSHELRTPLNAILGFSQLMSRDQSLMPEQQNNLNIINSSGEHLLGLINSILDLSKIEAGQMTLYESSFDLYHLLNTLDQMLHLKAASKGLTLKFEQDENVPQYIETDESKLRQVLINLLGNAIKYTETGQIILKIKSKVFPESYKNNRLNLVFEVLDTGTGISPEEIDNIFEAFVQTSSGQKVQQGTGLGLPISRKFVQMMGGEIQVKSQIGIGTTVEFEIPVTLTEVYEIQPQKPSQPVMGLEPDQPEYRILVVDDQWQNRKLLSQLLLSVGFNVQEAENGEKALELWKSWKADFIWMDIRMPVLDGYEATRRIRSAPDGDKVVIVALTASVFEQERKAVLNAGCDDFVRKPFQEEVIFEKLGEYLGVRYIYQQESESVDISSEGIRDKIKPEDLHIMSSEWRKQMLEAALVGRDQQMFDLIQAIPETHSSIANTLTQMIENFDFDEIVELTASENNSSGETSPEPN